MPINLGNTGGQGKGYLQLSAQTTPWVGTDRGSTDFDGCDDFCTTRCLAAAPNSNYASAELCTQRCAEACRGMPRAMDNSGATKVVSQNPTLYFLTLCNLSAL